VTALGGYPWGRSAVWVAPPVDWLADPEARRHEEAAAILHAQEVARARLERD
jgi:hypothetical protein